MLNKILINLMKNTKSITTARKNIVKLEELRSLARNVIKCDKYGNAKLQILYIFVLRAKIVTISASETQVRRPENTGFQGLQFSAQNGDKFVLNIITTSTNIARMYVSHFLAFCHHILQFYFFLGIPFLLTK